MTGRVVEAVTVSDSAPSLIDAADQKRRRAAERRQRYLAEGRASSQRRERDIDLPQQIAESQHVALIADDEFGDADLLLAAIGLPDRADAVERRSQRDHRARRQRHAEIAADGRGLPDLERSQERAAALIDQGRGEPFGRTCQRIELRDRAGRRDREIACRRSVSAGHFRSVRSISRVRWTCGSENSQVPPASQASPAVQTGSCARVRGWATSLMVFRSMDTPVLTTRCIYCKKTCKTDANSSTKSAGL